MAYAFHINKGSELPALRMELIENGKNRYQKFYLAIQGAKSVTFSMWNSDTGVFKIANAPAEVVYDEESGCEERYLLQYKWRKRDTDESGRFTGQFKIVFSDDIYMDGVTFPSGELVVPISEDLSITVNDAGLKR